MFCVTRLNFSYQVRGQKFNALQGVDLKIPSSAFLCITGPSGSGKTTLLNLLGLVEDLQEGDIHFESQSFRDLDETQKNQLRLQRFGFVFQQFNLFPVLTAEENISFFLKHLDLKKSEIEARVDQALEAVGLQEYRKKKPLELSGGQQQRVSIARAIAKKPRVIIADEPTASLDQKTGKQIMEFFLKINKSEKVAIVVSSHDSMVQEFCPMRCDLLDGKVSQLKGLNHV